MISVYLLLDLFPSPFPSPFPCLSPSPAQTPPQTPARPRLPSVPHTPPSPATETGRSVPRACGAAPLGDGNWQKCSPCVRRGAVRRRKRAEMSPGRAVMHRWATDSGRSVPRACGVATLGDGMGLKCRLGVRRSTLGRRNGRKCRPSVRSVPCV